MARFNQCSQCIRRAKLCTKCRTFLCYDHYVNHSCMIDKDPERGLDDPSESLIQYQERRDEELRQEEDL
jgi:hypothetical protein